MNNNFDRDPRRRGGGRRPHGHGDMSLVFMIIEMIFEVITFVIKTIAAVIAGNKLKDSLNKRSTQASVQREEPLKKKESKRSRAGEIAFLVIGIVFMVNAIANLIGFLTAPFIHNILSLAGIAASFLISGVSLAISDRLKKSGNRYDKYRVLIGDAEHFDLSALAVAANVSLRRVRRDVRKMIDKGEFGERAYIDLNRDIFFRSPEAGAEYEKAHAPKPETDVKKETKVEDEKQATDKVEKDEYRKIILEIRRLNDEIEDISVSERIYKIEEHTQNIFDFVKEHPEKRDNIRTFMNYYLPTTLKLLTSYAKIERVGVAGENMKRSKEDIEKTLDMLVYAFGCEVDMLFESESIDISSDIDVLETMMKRDGMTRGYGDDIFSGGAAAQSAPTADTDVEKK